LGIGEEEEGGLPAASVTNYRCSCQLTSYKTEGIIADMQKHVIINWRGTPHQESSNEISIHTDGGVG